MKEIYIDRPINLHDFLEKTDADIIIIRSYCVTESFNYATTTAHQCGFNVSHYIHPELEKKHEFPGCFRFTRIK